MPIDTHAPRRWPVFDVARDVERSQQFVTPVFVHLSRFRLRKRRVRGCALYLRDYLHSARLLVDEFRCSEKPLLARFAHPREDLAV